MLRRCTPLVLAVVMAAGLSAAAVPAVADPLPHGDVPDVVNPRPAPGAVVSGTGVQVAALVMTGQALTAHTLTVDGEPVPAAASAGDHATVGATVDLAPGRHTAELVVATAAGEARRAWTFDVDPVVDRRLSGDDRITTAVAISRDLYPETATAAVLARADDFPDALAGAPLATTLGGPLLLTGSDALAAPTAEELTRLLPETGTVALLGGEFALSAAVEEQVEALGLATTRLEGPDRFATAAAIAALVPESDTAVVATGGSFADALAVSSPAARDGLPILLTGPAALPAATRAHLEDGGFSRAVVVGGEAAVGSAVVAELEGLLGPGSVERIAGETRFETSVSVWTRFFRESDVPAHAVANGYRFPDALAGGPHAAALGAPLLLVDTADLPAAAAVQVTDALFPDAVVVYGGSAAVDQAVLDQIGLAVLDRGGPHLVDLSPGVAAEVEGLEVVRVEFDRDVDLAASSVYVEVGGNEARTTLATGDFPSVLVATVTELPGGLEEGASYPVRVVVAGIAGETSRHQEVTGTLRKPFSTLTTGDSGPAVRRLQELLATGGYWLGGADGQYGTLTSQAVMAFQKVHGLSRDGVYGPGTRALLEGAAPRPAPRSTSGFVVEIDKPRQVIMLVRDGAVEQVFNTSTGTEEPYIYEGAEYLADTPVGSFTIDRQVDGIREGNLGRLYRPKYFHPDGIAIHGSPSIPAYPASHGCARVTNAAMDWLWPRLPIGTRVLVY